jgi:hypothetical protein
LIQLSTGTLFLNCRVKAYKNRFITSNLKEWFRASRTSILYEKALSKGLNQKEKSRKKRI